MLEPELKKIDFRRVTRLLMVDGWHEVKGFRWMDILKPDRPNEGIAGENAMWLELEPRPKERQRQFIEVVAPRASIYAYGFGDDESLT